VTIAWQCPGPRASGAPRTWLRVELVEGTRRSAFPECCRFLSICRCSKGITVFYDRIQSLARGPNRQSALLAYVLVHEITHVVQGVNRHSQTGVMKAHWSTEDQTAILERRLGSRNTMCS